MRDEAKDNINLLLTMMQTTMKTAGVAIGYDLKNNKLVFKDIKTGLISRIDLEELNRAVFID